MPSCIICSDVFDSSSEVFVTRCGHLFHYPCVLGWLERSKSCPQCRKETTEETIHRVYINTENTKGTEDVGALQNNIEDLKLKLQVKEITAKHHKGEVEKLAKKNKNLREEMKNLETKLASSESNIEELKKDSKEDLEMYEDILEECRWLYNCIHTMNKELKEANDDVKQLESENLTLKRKIMKLEEALVSQSPARPQARASRRLIAKSPAPETIVRPKRTYPSESLTEDVVMTSRKRKV